MIVDHLASFQTLTTHFTTAKGKVYKIRIKTSISLVHLLIEEVTDILQYSNHYLVDQLEQAMEANYSHE